MWTTFLNRWSNPKPSPSVPFTTYKIHRPLATPRGPLHYAVALASDGDTEKVRTFTNFANTNVLTNPKYQFNAGSSEVEVLSAVRWSACPGGAYF